MHSSTLNNQLINELAITLEQLVQKGKGILAADESNGTIGKRFAAIKLANTAENRRAYRLLLATTSDLEQYISGVILFAETFSASDANGTGVADLFIKRNIVPGIKVDQGLTMLINTQDEKVTKGLDSLPETLCQFKNLGAKFAKWRNVYTISKTTPSLLAINTGAEILAQYAACCQAAGMVPIVEPEVLMDGEHSLDECAEASAQVLHALFTALLLHKVALEYIILKPSMITSGNNKIPFSSPVDVANYTLKVFRQYVPANVPSINFLSGGQTPQQATANLQAINSLGAQPWQLSFSYGRALQESCLLAWAGKASNITAAQQALLKRAQLNSAACSGTYAANMEL